MTIFVRPYPASEILCFIYPITPFPIGSLGPFPLFPALLAEIVAFYFVQRRNSTGPAGPESFALVFIVLRLANLAPLALSYILLGIMHRREGLVKFSAGSFFFSWALSVAIEYAVCRKVPMIKEIPHLLMTGGN